MALRDAGDSGLPFRRERGVVRRGKGVVAHGFLFVDAVAITVCLKKQV